MLIDEELTKSVIGAFYTVYNKLDWGFLENVYAGALERECAKRGLHVGREVPIAVWYDGVIVGSYRVDLLVERRLVLEIKACAMTPEHPRQLLNYLRCSELELGLLLYFDHKPQVKRVIFRNALKRVADQTLQKG
jgi:GxxExxY protein